MSTTFTWTITDVECIPSYNGENNVVTLVYWNCSGVNGNYSERIAGPCGLSYEGGDFTQYSDLTQDKILEWVWSSGNVSKEFVENSVEAKIQDLMTPSSVSLSLPWQN
jgi:hypothetical protein